MTEWGEDKKKGRGTEDSRLRKAWNWKGMREWVSVSYGGGGLEGMTMRQIKGDEE